MDPTTLERPRICSQIKNLTRECWQGEAHTRINPIPLRKGYSPKGYTSRPMKFYDLNKAEKIERTPEFQKGLPISQIV